MTQPRYTVGSVTGYTEIGRRPATIWYVHDRAHNYRIVRGFVGAYAKTLAHRWAATLNEPGEDHVCIVCGLTFPRRLWLDGGRPFWAKRCEHCQAQNLHPRTVPRTTRTPKTACKHGHPFTEENTYRTPKGHRECRICRAERVKERRLRAAA